MTMTGDNGAAVRLRGATKRFGQHTAVDHLSVEIPTGSITGLLGPNGSGKTTSIRMMMGILIPDEGEARLLGHSPSDDRARNRVGYLPEERGVYKKMKVVEQLVFLGKIRGLDGAEAKKRSLSWLERLGLEEWAEKKIQDLSKGMQQKVQFIGTVLHEPDFLILDEPFSGLDPINQDVLEEIVLDFHAKGTTILFSTHLMDQAERLCERVCLISRAKKVLDGDLKEIKKRERSGIVAIDFDGPSDWIDGPDVESWEAVGPGVRVQLRTGGSHKGLLERAAASSAEVTRFALAEPRLHEIFVRHAGAEAAAVEAGVPSSIAGGRSGGAA